MTLTNGQIVYALANGGYILATAGIVTAELIQSCQTPTSVDIDFVKLLYHLNVIKIIEDRGDVHKFKYVLDR